MSTPEDAFLWAKRCVSQLWTLFERVENRLLSNRIMNKKFAENGYHPKIRTSICCRTNFYRCIHNESFKYSRTVHDRNHRRRYPGALPAIQIQRKKLIECGHNGCRLDVWEQLGLDIGLPFSLKSILNNVPCSVFSINDWSKWL